MAIDHLPLRIDLGRDALEERGDAAQLVEVEVVELVLVEVVGGTVVVLSGTTTVVEVVGSPGTVVSGTIVSGTAVIGTAVSGTATMEPTPLELESLEGVGPLTTSPVATSSMTIGPPAGPRPLAVMATRSAPSCSDIEKSLRSDPGTEPEPVWVRVPRSKRWMVVVAPASDHWGVAR